MNEAGPLNTVNNVNALNIVNNVNPPNALNRRTVLVVDDEVTIAEAVAARLRSEGFDVVVAHDGPGAVALCCEALPDIVVLDVMLPGYDGYEVCRRIQQERRVPVIMLTARTDETDVLVGLGVGADDYIVKPFSPRELVARVQAVLRRVGDLQSPDPSAASNATAAGGSETATVGALRFGAVTFDVAARLVTNDGEVQHLTATEFDIAVHLLENPKQVFTRGQLLQSIWGYTDTSGERTVDSHIQAVRRKLGSTFVRTVHGVGYGLGTPPVSATGSASSPATGSASGPASGPASEGTST
jgi:DNA-binding response OmpR family regulator